jgi:hypothetical protein
LGPLMCEPGSILNGIGGKAAPPRGGATTPPTSFRSPRMALKKLLRVRVFAMDDLGVARMFAIFLLALGLNAAIYVWQHRPSLDNPRVPGPGLNVVTINPLGS